MAKGVSSYRVRKEENWKITLTPFVEIPFSEKWIFNNQEVLEKVKTSLCKLEN
ncbi:hypothetical protein [Candidatus Paracaedibacter symbiosus]|uniref:hypothetical protein n=1 Tax=Candidatus Paracaedibacter symbiosus TaxID=244582 RepID=UPI0018DEB1AD|nr:hypothetical protein [Candidatus Paracaedibacter symbiosus]